MGKRKGKGLFGTLLVGLMAVGFVGTAHAGSVIVNTDYVLKNKDKAGTILLDARAEDGYKKGHIPGAINLGGKGASKVLRDVDARILPTAKLEKILGDAGITREAEIIVYSIKGDPSATVPFWILEYLGAEKAKVYMGGIDDWATAKHPLAADVKKLPAAKFTAKVRADRLATTDYVKKNLKNKEVQILDVRTTKEFSGDDIRALRGGHIAGSVNIPYEQAWVDPEAAKKLGAGQAKDRHGMALKDDKGLAAIYKAFDPKKEVVALCQTGTRSTLTYAVLRDMGYTKVRNYDDSWIVWGSNLDLPVANTSYFDFVKVNAAMKKLDALEQRIQALEPKKK
ncbi:MAG: rhodanese-like domain-containing protein [Nitrospirota bacterium]